MAKHRENLLEVRSAIVYRPRRSFDGTSLDQITSRQKEVLALVAAGNSNEEIGRLLGISMRTVETHRDKLMQRLDIHNVADLTRYACLEGLITLK